MLAALGDGIALFREPTKEGALMVSLSNHEGGERKISSFDRLRMRSCGMEPPQIHPV
jgi:hypothetical protein